MRGFERDINQPNFFFNSFKGHRLELYHLIAREPFSLPHNAPSYTEGQSDFQLYLANRTINDPAPHQEVAP